MTRIVLWSDQPDGPTLTLYPCSEATSAAVMICPGGGYGHLADHEGEPVAKKLNAGGFHAAVLKYRHAPEHRHPAPIHDAQRAIRLLRAHAERFDAEHPPRRFAVLGFSAGGHLASSLAVHHDKFASGADELAGQHTACPDAAVLCYPVIDLSGQHAHTSSRDNLLGESATDAELAELLSTHRHVAAQTAPTFLWITADDGAVPVDNALMYAMACREAGVPFELHVYPTGRHGLGLAEEAEDVATWSDHACRFLRRYLLEG